MRQEITIAANDSGRLWTDDVERWNALCSPEGCIACQSEGLPSGMHLLAEPFDFSVEDQKWFWTDALLVARGVADVLRPTKMNYEIHGNTVPHLHMYLFPRSAGDVYVGYMIHHRVQFEQSAKDLENLKAGVVARLREAKRLA